MKYFTLGTILLAALVMVTSGCIEVDQPQPCCPVPPQSSTYVMVFVDPGLPACRAAKPYIEQLKARTTVIIVDVNKSPTMAPMYRVNVFPTYIVFREGVEIKRTRWAPQILQRHGPRIPCCPGPCKEGP